MEDGREPSIRQVYLRRLSLDLSKQRPDLFPFPILQFVEEVSKIFLMTEIELTHWYHLMNTYFIKLDGEERFSAESVRLFFFQTAMFVKRYMLTSPESHLAQQIEAIEEYIKTYHYSNFDKVYGIFDREDEYLLDPSAPAELPYEKRSCLAALKSKDVNRIFSILRKPLERDQRSNIVDYNWHVDKILKNSQSYNKSDQAVIATLVRKRAKNHPVYAYKGKSLPMPEQVPRRKPTKTLQVRQVRRRSSIDEKGALAQRPNE